MYILSRVLKAYCPNVYTVPCCHQQSQEKVDDDSVEGENLFLNHYLMLNEGEITRHYTRAQSVSLIHCVSSSINLFRKLGQLLLLYTLLFRGSSLGYSEVQLDYTSYKQTYIALN